MSKIIPPKTTQPPKVEGKTTINIVEVRGQVPKMQNPPPPPPKKG